MKKYNNNIIIILLLEEELEVALYNERSFSSERKIMGKKLENSKVDVMISYAIFVIVIFSLALFRLAWRREEDLLCPKEKLWEIQRTRCIKNNK
jgi:hypothetical protein